MAGHAVLLFLMDDHPAHLICELVTLPALHGDVGLVFIVTVDHIRVELALLIQLAELLGL